jgi:DUF1680 family protein
MAAVRPVTGRRVRVVAGFWRTWLDRLRREILPYQWRALEDAVPGAPPSYALRNLRLAAGGGGGEPLGRPFQDSDVAKWLEAASYVLEREPAPDLAAHAAEVVDLAARAQWPDGYLNSRFALDRSRPRWGNVRDDHELYVAGHWLEALVAYHRATGDRRALEVAVRLGDHLDRTFGPGPDRIRGYPGHPEVELALVKLWRATGDGRYLELARFFVYERGREPAFFALEAAKRGDERPYDPRYFLSHRPLLEQEHAVGHAVRAMYLYAGAADVAAARPDPALVGRLRALWQDVTGRQMYLTGGVGQEGHGEAFTLPYDLPSDRAYAETCAAVGLVRWAQRMLCLEGDGRYADTAERALYNGALAGVSADGRAYFYVNPLEVWPAAAAARHDLADVRPTRQPWFECACCPPNLARLIASVPDLLYGVGEDGATLFVHHYAASEAEVDLAAAGRVRVRQEGDYPWSGRIALSLSPDRPARWALALRLPGWARSAAVAVNGVAAKAPLPVRSGYVTVGRLWRPGDRVTVDLPMPVERVRAHPAVRDLAGRVALMRGPFVYAFEEADNGPDLGALALGGVEAWQARREPALAGGVVCLSGPGWRRRAPPADALYAADPIPSAAVSLTAIPYWAWANRTPGEMRVWLVDADPVGPAP